MQSFKPSHHPFLFELLDNAIAGRGATTNTATGNVRFRAVVAEHQPQYLEAKKEEKEGIARIIVETVHKRGGKFLMKNENGEYTEVDEKKALLKAQQALREGLNVRKSPEVKNKKGIKLPSTASKPPPAVAAASQPIAPRPLTATLAPASIHTKPSPKIQGDDAQVGGLKNDDVLCGRGAFLPSVCVVTMKMSSLKARMRMARLVRILTFRFHFEIDSQVEVQTRM